MSESIPKVLLVDDKEANLIALERLLRKTKVDTVRAYSGNDALSMLVSHQDISLILLDLNMPDMSGLEVAKILRDDEQLNDVPVIFITAAEQQSEQVAEAYALGAVDFIFKPINETILLAKVQVFLDLRLKTLSLEEAVSRSDYLRRFNARILDALPNPIFIQDESGTYKPSNMAAQHNGLPEFFARYVNENKVFFEEIEGLDEGQHAKCEWQLNTEESQHLMCECFMIDAVTFFAREDQGGYRSALVILNDISDQNRARRALENADKAKSNFLANISHEIRTPLNGIIGMAGLLSKETLTSRQREFISTIQNSGELLLSLLNDVLDFSKIEAGRIDIDITSFELNHLIEKVVVMFAGRSVEKGIEIVYQIEPDAQIVCRTDKTRLSQILTNLVSNAIKFTERGVISLHVSRVAQQNDESVLRFSVKDTGIGISHSAQKNLFDPFVQAEMSTTRKYGGTGLGLSICKRLVNLLGGEISVKSEPNKGAEFAFTLPVLVEKADTNLYFTEKLPKLLGKKALVVDDVGFNLDIMETHLSRWGMEVTTCNDPMRTELLLGAAASADLIVLDYQMPHFSGVQLAELFRQRLDACPPIILCSSSPELSIKERRLFAVVIYKPLRVSDFFNAVMRALFSNWRYKPDQDKTESTDDTMSQRFPLRILVAEDNEINSRLMRYFLEGCGYEAEFASNGLEALRMARQSQFDLILMDMLMPKMDGVEATREILRQQGDRAPRIIAVTANATADDKAQCLDAGMSGFLTKPIIEDELRTELQHSYRALYGSQGEMVTEGEATCHERVEEGQKLECVDDNNLWDTKRLAQLPLKLVEDLHTKFQEDFFESLKELADIEDTAEGQRIVHKMKGGALNMGLRELGSCCAHYQGELGNGNSLSQDDIQKLSRTARESLEALSVYISEQQ